MAISPVQDRTFRRFATYYWYGKRTSKPTAIDTSQIAPGAGQDGAGRGPGGDPAVFVEVLSTRLHAASALCPGGLAPALEDRLPGPGSDPPRLDRAPRR